ncbi:MAG TPA: helix-turn-helix transcriptional regulator [Solirubrobacterales bacterium]|jgi:transcriptional regulator with XRE-family HTH domain|nr:helix-turn-helix transcriptional regulator [Solirubrobacterales bacterium]
MNERECEEMLGHNLRVTRELSGLSRWELAERSKVSERTISNIEEARQSAEIHTVFQLAEALDSDIADLLQGIEWTPGEDPNEAER